MPIPSPHLGLRDCRSLVPSPAGSGQEDGDNLERSTSWIGPWHPSLAPPSSMPSPPVLPDAACGVICVRWEQDIDAACHSFISLTSLTHHQTPHRGHQGGMAGMSRACPRASGEPGAAAGSHKPISVSLSLPQRAVAARGHVPALPYPNLPPRTALTPPAHPHHGCGRAAGAWSEAGAGTGG